MLSDILKTSIKILKHSELFKKYFKDEYRDLLHLHVEESILLNFCNLDETKGKVFTDRFT